LPFGTVTPTLSIVAARASNVGALIERADGDDSLGGTSV
jgi:hypothetical protein